VTDMRTEPFVKVLVKVQMERRYRRWVRMYKGGSYADVPEYVAVFQGTFTDCIRYVFALAEQARKIYSTNLEKYTVLAHAEASIVDAELGGDLKAVVKFTMPGREIEARYKIIPRGPESTVELEEVVVREKRTVVVE